MEKLNVGEFVHQHRLTSLNDVLTAQIKEHFHSFKSFYGILLILLTYIFVALFGNFWKITSKRTVEIGIRRAVGHSRGKVVFYILAESLVLLAFVMLPATIIYLNLYKVINITAPLPVYLISTGMLLFIVLLATLIPAIRAGHIHPVEALAEE
jgi:ABC-type antimicrobial peptide transport system permease subunit